MRLLSTRTNANDVAKHKKKRKCGCYAQQEKMRFLSIRTRASKVPKTRTSANDVGKH